MGMQRENRIARLFRYVTSGRVEFRPFPLVIKLSPRETARLLKNMECPPPPNAALKKALALYKQAIGNP